MKKFRCELRSWENIDLLSKQVSEKIIASGFEPDAIIGVTRGGWVPARNLCDLIGVKELLGLKIEHWGVTANPDGKARITHPINADLKGKKTLLVDDITDTGESLKLAKEYVQKLHPKELKVATLQYLTGSSFTPDYWAETIDSKNNWTWVIYPWNATEDLCNLTGNIIEEKAGTIEEIRKAFKENYQLDLGTERVKKTLEEMKRRKMAAEDGKNWRRIK